MAEIRLFINWFKPKDPIRELELEFALYKNLNNKEIDGIYVIENNPLPIWTYQYHNLKVQPWNGKPSYKDFYYLMKFYKSSDSINIVANTDIFYDNSIVEAHRLPTDDVVIALSRWDRVRREWVLHKAQHLSKDSQDSWIFRGIPEVLAHIDFSMGTPGCDNSLAWHLAKRYSVINPAFTIKSYHSHSSEIRYYTRDRASLVKPPYHFIPAHRW